MIAGLFAILAVVAFSYERSQSELQREIRVESNKIIATLLVATDLDTTQANIIRVISTLAARENIVTLKMIDPRSHTIIASNNFAEIDKPISHIEDTISQQLVQDFIATNDQQRISLIQGNLL